MPFTEIRYPYLLSGLIKCEPARLFYCWFEHFDIWCARGDLNPYIFRHRLLRPACLPVPPPARLNKISQISTLRSFEGQFLKSYFKPVGRHYLEPLAIIKALYKSTRPPEATLSRSNFDGVTDFIKINFNS